MDIASIQFATQYPWGHFWGIRGSQIQKSVEAVKRLDRLAPNLDPCAYSSGNGYTPNKLPFETQGGTWGFYRGQTFKSLEKLSNGWTDWHQLWFTSGDSSGNGHRLNASLPTIPQGALGGGVWGSQIQMSGEAVKRLDRLAPNLVHVCGFVWEWTWLNTIRPQYNGGISGVLGGHKFKSEKAAKRMDRLSPNVVHVCEFICEWT